MKPEIRIRLSLLDILDAVLEQRRSLSVVLPHYLQQFVDPRHQALIQFCAYGVCREFFRLDFFIQKLAARPIKDKKIYYLLLIGLFQLSASRMPNFAVVNTLVECAKKLKLSSSTGLINALLRAYLRQHTALHTQLSANPSTQYAHPAWLLDALKTHWPTRWESICMANNQLPPMWLRINQQKVTPAEYVNLLHQANKAPQYQQGTACCLPTPCAVTALPHFSDGWVSVQDAAAQLAAEFLDLQAGQRVLDACAAPGGKTGHILEQQPLLATLVALDKDPLRSNKIQENLRRLSLNATVIVGDATEPATWWDQQLFDRILLDAPCSATGIIRRHPDIKLLRRAEDIPLLAEQQLRLLHTLWPLLKPKGKLVYVTCSILPEENEQLVATFCQEQKQAQCLPIVLPVGTATPHGWQLFPGEGNMDGFFYSTLLKN